MNSVISCLDWATPAIVFLALKYFLTMKNSEDILALLPSKADERIDYGSDPNQFIELRLPKENGLHPLVINIHGGYWRAKYSLEHAGHLCAALTAKGAVTANLEYRRVGNEGGGWPGTFEDIRNAYRFILQNSDKFQIDKSKVMVMGHSAGGQLALCLAAHERTLSGVISLSGVLDLQKAYELHLSNDAVVEFLGGAPSEVWDHYAEASPMELSIDDARQWIFHGGKDDTVPCEFSRNYVKKKKKQKEKVELIEDAQAGHFDVIDPQSKIFKQIEQVIFQTYLGQ